MGEPSHQHRSYLFEARQSGGHVHVTVREGRNSSGRAPAGHLTLEPWAWVVLSVILDRGATAAEAFGEPVVEIVEHVAPAVNDF